LLYLLLGETRLGARRQRRHQEIRGRIQSLSASHWGNSRYPTIAPEHQPIATLAEGVGGTAPRGGNTLSLHGDTERVIELLEEDIGRAVDHCHLLFYIYLTDDSGQRVAAALMAAARRGVKCRLLVDSVGSADLLGSSLTRRMREAGVQVVSALPATPVRALFARLDLRNHRKLAVIDGVVGYTGSQNIEGLLELAPPSTEDDIAVQVIPTGPGYDNEAMAQLIQASFHVAREEVILTTPYFVPDEATVVGLCTAAKRGVHAALVVPARNDSPLVALASRSFYQTLLRAGVEIWEYTEGLLHAKTVTIDRDLAVITTANLDRRSMELNFEVSIVVYDSDFTSRLRFLQRSYMGDSRRLDPDRWSGQPRLRRLLQNAAGMMSPLL
jgi:cardiolipin synthase